MNQPHNPQIAVNGVPLHIRDGILNTLRAAYDHVDNLFANNLRLSAGPLADQAEGFNRYVLVAHEIAAAVEEGRLAGAVRWIDFPKSASGQYLELSFDGYAVTFSHVKQLHQLPRQATYRLDRAHDNQLMLIPEDTQEENQAANIVLLHGDRNLNFAQFVMLGIDDKDKQCALAYSDNLIDGAEGFGHGGITPVGPDGPIKPVPSEEIKTAQIALKEEFNTERVRSEDER